MTGQGAGLFSASIHRSVSGVPCIRKLVRAALGPNLVMHDGSRMVVTGVLCRQNVSFRCREVVRSGNHQYVPSFAFRSTSKSAVL